MAKVINEVKFKEDVLMMLLKNQTSILDSTINIVRKSKSSTDNRIRNLEQQLATINKERGRYQGDHLQQAFVILTAQLTLLATGMQRMQAEIASVLTDVRHRTISPMLITPKQLRDQLDKIRDHLPPDQMLPVSSENAMELYKIMRAEGTTTTDHVIFKMTVPLVSTAQQEVFSIIPIPTWHSGGWNRFDIKTPIIAENSHRDQFIGLTEDEFEQCLVVSNNEHICFNDQAAFNAENRCEFQLFNNKSKTLCEIIKSKADLIWLRAHQRNRWMFATHNQIELQAVCKGVPSTIHLNGSGLLSLSSGCTARNVNISISTFSTMITESNLAYIRFGNITTPDVKDTSESARETATQPSESDELDRLQQRLAKLKDTAWSNQFTTVQHHQVATYAALAISIILIIAYSLRRRFVNWKPRQPTCTNQENDEQPSPEPNPRSFACSISDG
ncbi:uncharacterized protein [Drosophila takahashii]|uniref:uncharacterized protein n=1 Tax=Drosophila takahashii TaxID=29030 RepID=UPI00389937F7